MLKIDAELLVEVGLEKLPKWEEGLLLQYIYETLEMRVGVKLADRFSRTELDEFEVFFEKRDEDGAFEWLQEKAPDYKDVVAAEFELMKEQLTDEVSSILELSEPARPIVDEAAGSEKVDPDDVTASRDERAKGVTMRGRG